MKINEKVFLLDSTKGAYAYIIIEKKTILIDTGLPFHAKGILKELATMKYTASRYQAYFINPL